MRVASVTAWSLHTEVCTHIHVFHTASPVHPPSGKGLLNKSFKVSKGWWSISMIYWFLVQIAQSTMNGWMRFCPVSGSVVWESVVRSVFFSRIRYNTWAMWSHGTESSRKSQRWELLSQHLHLMTSSLYSLFLAWSKFTVSSFRNYLRCSLPSTIFLKSTLPGNGRTTANMRSSQSRNFSQRLRCLRIIAMTSL